MLYHKQINSLSFNAVLLITILLQINENKNKYLFDIDNDLF